MVSTEALTEGRGAGDFDRALQIKAGPVLVGQEFLLGGVTEIPLGKLETNAIRLPGNLVSRAHAKLVRLDYGPSRWKVVDTQSRNGLLVNGEKVAEAELQVGDVIRVGEFELIYRNALYEPAAAPAAPRVAGAGAGPECPCCGKRLGSKGKLCVACGINVETGRPVLTTHGVDEDALHVHAEQIIQVASFLIPVTLFPIPIASEAYGAVKPWAIRIIAILAVVASLGFLIFTWSDEEAGKNLMLWPPESMVAKGDSPIEAILKKLTPQQLDRKAREYDQQEPHWLKAVMPEGRGDKSEVEFRREAVRKVLAAEAAELASRGEFHWYQFITHAFLHDNSSVIGFILHLGGNMLFLLVFGTRVNALIGNVATALLYPVLALAGAAGHLYFGHPTGAMLGASGAINGLAGMYLILFPVHRVYCSMWIRLRWHLWFKIFTLRGFWVLLIYFTYDALMAAFAGREGGGTAHWAHLGGFGAGIVIAIALLASRRFDARGDLLSVVLGKHAWAIVGKPNRGDMVA